MFFTSAVKVISLSETQNVFHLHRGGGSAAHVDILTWILTDSITVWKINKNICSSQIRKQFLIELRMSVVDDGRDRSYRNRSASHFRHVSSVLTWFIACVLRSAASCLTASFSHQYWKFWESINSREFLEKLSTIKVIIDHYFRVWRSEVLIG